MKSYFAWPSCVYLIKNQIKLLIRWSQDGHAKKIAVRYGLTLLCRGLTKYFWLVTLIKFVLEVTHLSLKNA